MLFSMLIFTITGAIVSLFTSTKPAKRGVQRFLIVLALAAFGCSLIAFVQLNSLDNKNISLISMDWIKTGTITIPFVMTYDYTAAILSLIITTILNILHFSTLLNMDKRPSLRVMSAKLNLLLFMLLGLVLSKSLPALALSIQGIMCTCDFLFNSAYQGQPGGFSQLNSIGVIMLPGKRISAYLIELDKKVFDGVLCTLANIIMATAGVTSFSMTGSIRRHASIMVLGFIILALLALLGWD